MKNNKLIGFVVAMEKEAKFILDIAKIKEKTEFSGKLIILGSIWQIDFVLIISGIGKVNAGLATQLLIDKFSPIEIINFGVAGGKKGSGLRAGDVVQVKEVCQYDFDLSELDNVNIGYMQDFDLTYYPTSVCSELSTKYPPVRCATGDRFTSKKMFLDIIRSLKAQIVGMECGAIAQVCYSNRLQLYVIKLISDVDGTNDSIYLQYANNVKFICDKIRFALKDLIYFISNSSAINR